MTEQRKHDRRTRRAANEKQVRTQNRAVSGMVSNLSGDEDRGELPVMFLCECSNTACHDRIELTIEGYDRIHAVDYRFAVKPGHQEKDLEAVAEHFDAYLVVDKHPAFHEAVKANEPA